MNEELAERYAEQLRETIGWPGRMISHSKSGFRERNPTHAAVFNANVCLEAGKIWWGDLDLTLDEPKVAALAERIDETVYVLYESDGLFKREQRPLLERAVYSVVPSGHTRFRHGWIERAVDGTLRHRPPPPETRRRLMLTLGRPRLWRFWRIERVARRGRFHDEARTTLLYIGQRGEDAHGHSSPLLVLGFFRSRRPGVWAQLEYTWYPTPKRHAARPLFSLRPRRRRGRLRPYAYATVHPGFMYELDLGFVWIPRW